MANKNWLEKEIKISLGGTMRLGAYDCKLLDNSFVGSIIKKDYI